MVPFHNTSFTHVLVFISCPILYVEIFPNNEYLVIGEVDIHVKINQLVAIEVDNQIKSQVCFNMSDPIYFVASYTHQF
ncbi:MAG: hypothetical protein WCL18_04935 [bacterium]